MAQSVKDRPEVRKKPPRRDREDRRWLLGLIAVVIFDVILIALCIGLRDKIAARNAARESAEVTSAAPAGQSAPATLPAMAPASMPAASTSPGASAAPSAAASAEPSVNPSADASETSASPSAAADAAPTASADTPSVGGAGTVPTSASADGLYQFGTALEESDPAPDDSVFSSAVFLGDSRTEGLQLWGGLKNGTFYWARGMTVFEADNSKYTFKVDGVSMTMIDALKQGNYDKVYIMIGVNELGYPVSDYEEGMDAFLDKVIAAQPEAVIYLQTLPPLNDAKARQNLAYYENNDNVNAFNDVIVRKAAEKRVVLLDTAQRYRGSDGQLSGDLTVDGCHFTRDGYTIWADYLRCHIMDKDRYFASRDAAEGG